MMLLLAETLTTWHYIAIIFLILVILVLLSIPAVYVFKMNTNQHVHRQMLNSDFGRIEWCEEQIANARDSRNNIKHNQAVMDTKLDFIIDHTPALNENQKTGLFEAIEAEPEKPSVPPRVDPTEMR